VKWSIQTAQRNGAEKGDEGTKNERLCQLCCPCDLTHKERDDKWKRVEVEMNSIRNAAGALWKFKGGKEEVGRGTA